MPITSLQIPLLGNLMVLIDFKGDRQIYYNHLIINSRQYYFEQYCSYRFAGESIFPCKNNHLLWTRKLKRRNKLSPCHDLLVFSVIQKITIWKHERNPTSTIKKLNKNLISSKLTSNRGLQNSFYNQRSIIPWVIHLDVVVSLNLADKDPVWYFLAIDT